MKAIFLLLVAFLAIGTFTRTYDRTARLLLIVIIGAMVLYVSR